MEVCWPEMKEESVATGFACNDIRVVQLDLVDGGHVMLRQPVER